MVFLLLSRHPAPDAHLSRQPVPEPLCPGYKSTLQLTLALRAPLRENDAPATLEHISIVLTTTFRLKYDQVVLHSEEVGGQLEPADALELPRDGTSITLNFEVRLPYGLPGTSQLGASLSGSSD